jgi:antitoxin component YwqK of YwqJK toxin-antitoxin module
MSSVALPKRPEGIPESAQFNEQARTWVVGDLDGNGKPHGQQWVYSAAGELVSEMYFEHGDLHGPFKRFHPNGEIAREGEFSEGQLHGEVVAYASADPSPERLRACCVPSQARSLKIRYDHGRRLSEIFYDERDRRLLDDGTLYPDRPANVDGGARYIAGAARWVLGKSDEKHRKHGRWRWWSVDGHPTEDAHYEHGERHGVSRFYVAEAQSEDEDNLARLSEYAHGRPHGRQFARLPEGTYADETIVGQRGSAHEGRMCGAWQWYDAAGSVVAQTDFGPALSELEVLEVVRGNSVSASGSLEAEIHSLVEVGDAAALRARLEESVIALAADASARTLKQIRNGKFTWEQRVAETSQALLRGADPSAVLRELASLLLSEPERAVPYAEMAVALDSDNLPALVTRALVRLEVGALESADADIESIATRATEAGEQLRHSRQVFYPEFDFWPRQVEFGEHTTPELPDRAAQPLEVIQQTIAKSVERLRQLEHWVIEQAGEPARGWLPALPEFPEVSVELDTYSFEVVDEAGTDTVVVDEVLDQSRGSVAQLMRRVRLEWTTLCWLCWGAGLGEVRWPTRLEPRPDFARAITCAFQRHWRAQDRIQTGGLRAKVQKVPGFDWHGRSIDQLTGVHAQMALAEQLEMRAVLFFLGDESCRSPWQDDLRG